MKGDALPGEQAQQPDGLGGNEAPLMAGELAGYGLRVLKTEAERRAELAERAPREERDKARFTELLHGKAAA